MSSIGGANTGRVVPIILLITMLIGMISISNVGINASEAENKK